MTPSPCRRIGQGKPNNFVVVANSLGFAPSQDHRNDEGSCSLGERQPAKARVSTKDLWVWSEPSGLPQAPKYEPSQLSIGFHELGLQDECAAVVDRLKALAVVSKP